MSAQTISCFWTSTSSTHPISHSSISGFSKPLVTFMLHHWLIPAGLPETRITVLGRESYGCLWQELQGRGFLSASSPASTGVRGLQGSPQVPQPPSSIFPGDIRCCYLGVTWEKGEARQSGGIGRAEERGSGGKGSFPLYGLILSQLSGAKNLTRRKIIPSLSHISSDEAFLSLCHTAHGDVGHKHRALGRQSLSTSKKMRP